MFHSYLTTITSTLHQTNIQYILIIPCSVLLTVRNVTVKNLEKIKTFILLSITFFFPENPAFYETMCKNTVEADRPQMIWRMCIACWMTKATNTHSQYAILITFPLKQWLHERAPCYDIRTLAAWVVIRLSSDSSYVITADARLATVCVIHMNVAATNVCHTS